MANRNWDMTDKHLQEGWFGVMRPYPYTICNAAKPDECVRKPDGSCEKCSCKSTNDYQSDKAP